MIERILLFVEVTKILTSVENHKTYAMKGSGGNGS
jgi:hypothetical protein